MEGPDHKASLEPQELKGMVDAIRQVERALGSYVKKPTVSEVKNKLVARKSLVAAKDIAIGELLTEANLTIKRPGSGISPYQYWDYIGTASNQNYKAGGLIRE